MADTDPQLNMRIPESLRDLIRDAAKQNRRSLTAEVVDRLEESFAREGLLKGPRSFRPRSADDPDTRELIVMMELMMNQLDLMRRELDARMKGLKSEDEPS
ncbi:hypothetical protein GCM10027040_27830 [Halomonas shantousis]